MGKAQDCGQRRPHRFPVDSGPIPHRFTGNFPRRRERLGWQNLETRLGLIRKRGQCVLNDAPCGALVGRVGADGVPFWIGGASELTAPASETLCLAVYNTLGVYHHNHAGVTVVFANCEPLWAAHPLDGRPAADPRAGPVARCLPTTAGPQSGAWPTFSPAWWRYPPVGCSASLGGCRWPW
jgi:hypothetical protein